MTKEVVRTSLLVFAVTAICAFCMPGIAHAQQDDNLDATAVVLHQEQPSSAESIEALPTESSNEDDAVEGTVSGDESEDSANQDQSAIDPDVNTDADDTDAAEGDGVTEDEAVFGDVEADSTSEAVVDATATLEAAPVADAGSVSVQSSESVVPQAAPGYWVVSDLNNGYGLQRYWYEASGVCASNRLIDPSADGSGWWAFATEHGFVVRGRYVALDGTIYFADNDGRLENVGWLVTGVYTGGDLQRYWIDGVKHGAIQGYSPDGWDHYTMPEGYVLRGTYDTGYGMVYVADNDGRLASANGWLVTGAYTGGALERYYIDSVTHAARSGYFSVDGANYYGLGNLGYVARGFIAGVVADNDGKLASSTWVVTENFGQGLQRYWFGSDGQMARNRLISASEAGWEAYATVAGYVVRGAYDTGSGMVYLADNDGRVTTARGMLVTGEYTGGVLQRYYIDPVTHAARSGFFTVAGYGDCFGVGGAGYVMRGKLSWGNYVLLADNDGRMVATDGWIVTGAFDNGSLQRYWMDTCWDSHYKGARTLYFNVDGSNYFGLPGDGYVVRGEYQCSYGLLVADNDGRMFNSGYMNGVDIASWQAGIDIRNLDASFVIIKATQGTDYINPYYDEWAATTLACGKKLGFYHFIDPTNSSYASAIAEADFFVDAVANYIGSAVLVLDWEAGGNNGYFELGNTTYAKWFLDRVKERTGVTPLIYMSKSVTNEYDWSSIASTNSLWMAQYMYANMYSSGYLSSPSATGQGTGAWNGYPLYQYSSTATISGYNGYLDVNIFYGGSVLWDRYAARS